MSKKLYLITYGCQMNEYDSTKMASVLEASHGYTRTQDPDEADLLLLNTCSVREKAQEKVFSELGRWKDWKAAQPGRVIGVGGCVASQEGEAIARRAPMVDLVFGPQTLHRLPELLDTTRRTRKPAVDISFPEIEKFDRLPEPRAEGVTAFVSIMEGCSKYCHRRPRRGRGGGLAQLGRRHPAGQPVGRRTVDVARVARCRCPMAWTRRPIWTR